MVDCLRCSAQNWELKEVHSQYVELKCGSCGINSKVGTSSDNAYYDCHLCLSTVWDIVDRTEDHIMFECGECSSVVEFWLRSDEN